jgi:hypothetical protein
MTFHLTDEPWCMDTVYDIKQQEVPTTKGVICLESSQEAYFFQIIIRLGYLADRRHSPWRHHASAF